MCGRYQKAKADRAILARKFGVREEDLPEDTGETLSAEAAPGSMQEVVRVRDGERGLEQMRWGFNLPIQGKMKTVFNTKSEGVMTSAMWRSRFQKNRCIVPAAAFIEWPGKVKTAIAIRGQDVIGFAGLWGIWANPKNNQAEPTFSIFTTEPNGIMRPIHNRQPVVLDPSEYGEWLEATERPPVHLLRVFPEELTVVTPMESNTGWLW